jgi:hypothetical protein
LRVAITLPTFAGNALKACARRDLAVCKIIPKDVIQRFNIAAHLFLLICSTKQKRQVTRHDPCPSIAASRAAIQSFSERNDWTSEHVGKILKSSSNHDGVVVLAWTAKSVPRIMTSQKHKASRLISQMFDMISIDIKIAQHTNLRNVATIIKLRICARSLDSTVVKMANAKHLLQNPKSTVGQPGIPPASRQGLKIDRKDSSAALSGTQLRLRNAPN